MKTPFSYHNLFSIINMELKKQMDITIIDANSNGPGPEYPFFTYKVMDSHMPIGFTDNVESEQFEMSISMEAHSDKGTIDALEKASMLRKVFLTQSMDILAAKHNFYIIDTGNIESLDNLISIQVENRAAFTLNIRALDDFEDDTNTVENILINGNELPHK